MEDLEQQIACSDFAVLIAAADDVVISKGSSSSAPRDNVIFELGLFMGALSRKRTFMLVPTGLDLKIPTDLLGLTLLRYAEGAKLASSVDAARDTLRSVILANGAR